MKELKRVCEEQIIGLGELDTGTDYNCLTLNYLKSFLIECEVVIIELSSISECVIRFVVENPTIEMLDDVVCIKNHDNENDENFIHFCMEDYQYDKFNSSKGYIVLNSKINFINTLNIRKVFIKN